MKVFKICSSITQGKIKQKKIWNNTKVDKKKYIYFIHIKCTFIAECIYAPKIFNLIIYLN